MGAVRRGGEEIPKATLRKHAAAASYERAVGVASFARHQVGERVREQVEYQGRDGEERYRYAERVSWENSRNRDGAPSKLCVKNSLFGDLAIAATVKRTKLVVIDVDVHYRTEYEEKQAILSAKRGRRSMGAAKGLDAYIRGGTWSAARRKMIGRHAGKVVKELRERWGPSVQAETSARGIHAFVLLDEYVDAERAREIGLALLSGIGRAEGVQGEGPVGVEVFPSREGRICRIPLTGGARLLADDMENRLFEKRLRVNDVEALVAAPRMNPRKIPTILLVGGAAKKAEEEMISARGSRDSKIRKLEGKLDDVSVRSLVQVVLAGNAFASVCEYLVRDGIPNDASRGASGKLAALLIYGGVEERDAVDAFRVLISNGKHRSTRCSSERGRDKLLSTFFWDYRRGARLVRQGIWRFGELRRKDLVALVDELLEKRKAA